MIFEVNDLIAVRYSIIKLLDEGGMSYIYLAMDTKLHYRKVVMKVMKNQFVMSSYLIEKEAETLTQLNHPYLPQIYDFFVQEQYPIIVMEYIQGEVLSQQHNFSLSQKLYILTQLSEIIAYLHHREMPIIHGDLKPNNIVIDQQNNIKLIDFGISSYQLKNLVQPNPSQIVKFGTPMYMAPELLAGDIPTTESDAYSFAMIVLFLWGKDKSFLQHSAITVEQFTMRYLDELPSQLVQILYYLLQPLRVHRRYSLIEINKQLNSIYAILSDEEHKSFSMTERRQRKKIAVLNINDGAGATTVSIVLARALTEMDCQIACIEVANQSANLCKSYLGKKYFAEHRFGYCHVVDGQISYYFDKHKHVPTDGANIVDSVKMFDAIDEDCIIIDLSSISNRWDMLQYLGEQCIIVLVSSDDAYIGNDTDIIHTINNLQKLSNPIIHIQNKVIEHESESFLVEWLTITRFIQIPYILERKKVTHIKQGKWLASTSKMMLAILKIMRKSNII